MKEGQPRLPELPRQNASEVWRKIVGVGKYLPFAVGSAAFGSLVIPPYIAVEVTTSAFSLGQIYSMASGESDKNQGLGKGGLFFTALGAISTSVELAILGPEATGFITFLEFMALLGTTRSYIALPSDKE